MKLYYSPGACSLSPHIVANEAGVPVELVRVDLRAGKTADGRDYRAINPKGYVPALELDDGTLLTEGPAIVQYLADLKPGSGLAPAAGSMQRYRLQEMLTFIGTELHKTYSPLFDPSSSPELRANRQAMLQKRYGLIEGILKSSPFLLGDQFGAADAYLFTVTSWAPHVQLDLAGFPALQAFQQKVGGRPQVQVALREEGLLK